MRAAEVSAVPGWAPAAPTQDAELASYALVRVAALDYPAITSAAEAFRQQLDRLVRLLDHQAVIAPVLTEALYQLADGYSADRRRSILLPLRRAIHNGRGPGSLPDEARAELVLQLPLLDVWLTNQAAIDEHAQALAAQVPDVLDRERSRWATVYGSEELGRATALTSPDLSRGIRRAASLGAGSDPRSRKAEATVLRYALRTTAKTSPLSWFTHVGWGEWGPSSEPAGSTVSGGDDPIAVTRAPAILIDTLVRALLADPVRRLRVPHHLAPGAIVADGALGYYRQTRLTDVAGQLTAIREERVRVPVNAGLAAVVSWLDHTEGLTPEALIARLVARTRAASNAATAQATSFVTALLDQQVITPIVPAAEQDPLRLARLAEWLASADLPDLAHAVKRIAAGTTALADTAAEDRPARLADLTRLWQDTLATAGGSTPVRAPVTEDVVLAAPLRLGRAHGATARTDLLDLMPLVRLFDEDHVIRQVLTQRFVERYGTGGRCRDIGAFFEDVGTAWWSPLSPDDEPPRSPELDELRRLRAEIIDHIAAMPIDNGEITLPADLVTTLPAWMTRRASSYSFFVQPDSGPGDTVLCLNQVYGGWGRFTSRFLDLFPGGGPRAAVADQLSRYLTHPAQFRPLQGFNANLHPRLVADEISDDPRQATILTSRLELAHDPATDQVRLRDTSSGALLDVLYLGFLAPFALPVRVAALLGDLGFAGVNLGRLAPPTTVDTGSGIVVTRPRLRSGRVVVSRRSWTFDQLAARTIADSIAGCEPIAVARARARWHLPEQVFLSEATTRPLREPDDFRRLMARPKPQFADLASPLHHRCLGRWLARIDGSLAVHEALPAPDRRLAAPSRVTELVIEAYSREVDHS